MNEQGTVVPGQANERLSIARRPRSTVRKKRKVLYEVDPTKGQPPLGPDEYLCEWEGCDRCVVRAASERDAAEAAAQHFDLGLHATRVVRIKVIDCGNRDGFWEQEYIVTRTRKYAAVPAH